MGWLQFLSSIAWPVAVIVIVVLLLQSKLLRGQVLKSGRVKHGTTEAELVLGASVTQMITEAAEEVLAVTKSDPAVNAAEDASRVQTEFSERDAVSTPVAERRSHAADNAALVERIRALADSRPRAAMSDAIKAFELSMAELAYYRAERRGLRLVKNEAMSMRDLVNNPNLVSEAFQRELITLTEWESWTAVRTTKAMLLRGHTPTSSEVLQVLQLAELATTKATLDLLERS